MTTLQATIISSFIFTTTGCITIYMPSTKNPTAFTHKKDFILSAELGPHLVASNLAYTPIENFYVHGEVANFRESSTGHFNNITSFGIGAYKLIDSTNQIEIQASYGAANFDYGDPTDDSTFNLTEADGNSKIYSCFLSYNKIQPNILHSLVLNVGSVNVHYSYCNFPFLEGTTQNSLNVSVFYVGKFRLANHLKIFIAPGINYLSNSTDRIRHNEVSLRFGVEIKFK